MHCSHKPEELVLVTEVWFQIKTSMYMDTGLHVACTVLRPVLWGLSPHTPKWVAHEGAQVCNMQMHTAVHGYAWTSPGVHGCIRCMWMTFLRFPWGSRVPRPMQVACPELTPSTTMLSPQVLQLARLWEVSV